MWYKIRAGIELLLGVRNKDGSYKAKFSKNWELKKLIGNYITFFMIFCTTLYFIKPSLNIKDHRLWVFAIITCICLVICTSEEYYSSDKSKSEDIYNKLVITLTALLLSYVLFIAISSPFISYGKHARILESEVKYKSVSEFPITLEDINIIGTQEAEVLARQAVVENKDLAYKYKVRSISHIIVKGKPYAVAELGKRGVLERLKVLEAIPGYILVDKELGTASYIDVEEGLRYSNDAAFLNNLRRYIKTHDLASIISRPVLELDENMEPVWVLPVIKNKVGYFGGKDIVFAYTVDPITGEISKVSKDNGWIDNMYTNKILEDQLSWHSYYVNGDGRLELILGDQDMLKVVSNDIVYNGSNWFFMKEGSINGDTTGVYFVNKLTKEVIFYKTILDDNPTGIVRSDNGVDTDSTDNQVFPINVDGRLLYIFRGTERGKMSSYVILDASNYSNVISGDNIADLKTKLDILTK